MRSYEMTEIVHRGLTECLTEAFAIATDGCEGVFLSVDIDVCDPGHAPGTGTPEPGGLTARELLDAVRRICLELPVVGVDVVEVSPPYDHADITAALANRVVLEALSSIARRRQDERDGTTWDPAGHSWTADPVTGQDSRTSTNASTTACASTSTTTSIGCPPSVAVRWSPTTPNHPGSTRKRWGWVSRTRAPASPMRCARRTASKLAGQTGGRAARGPEAVEVPLAGRDPLEDVDDVERGRAVRCEDARGGDGVVARVELRRLLDGQLTGDQHEVVGRRGERRHVGQGREAHERDGPTGAGGAHDGLGAAGPQLVRPRRHADAAQSVGSVVRRTLPWPGPCRGPRGADRHRDVAGTRVGQHGGGVAGRHVGRHVADHGRHAAQLQLGARGRVQDRQRVVDPRVDVEDHPPRACLASSCHDTHSRSVRETPRRGRHTCPTKGACSWGHPSSPDRVQCSGESARHMGGSAGGRLQTSGPGHPYKARAVCLRTPVARGADPALALTRTARPSRGSAARSTSPRVLQPPDLGSDR